MYLTSIFPITCGTRVATKGPQRKPREQLLDMEWTLGDVMSTSYFGKLCRKSVGPACTPTVER